MKKLILISLFVFGLQAHAAISGIKTAAMVKALDGDKVKVSFGNKDYWIPKSEVIGNSAHLKSGQPVMISLRTFDLNTMTNKK